MRFPSKVTSRTERTLGIEGDIVHWGYPRCYRDLLPLFGGVGSGHPGRLSGRPTADVEKLPGRFKTRASFNETYLSLSPSASSYEVFDPPCVVIIGRVESLASPDQRRSFELFRRQLKGVDVIGFDELFGRLRLLIRLLESRSGPSSEPSNEEPDWSF